jgi:ribulose-5-phosphate 4-epimerase/fuculose-1-phosphate aldolase
MSDLIEMKTRLAKVVRIITAGGIWPLTKGHVSARIEGEDRMMILGHIHAEGRTLDTTEPEDFIVVDFDGNKVEGRGEPPGEVFIHSEVYRSRADVASVIHAHLPTATAFGVAERPIVPVGNRGGIFAPEVPILPFDGQIETRETGRAVAEKLGKGYAVVLRNHGTVTVGDTIENACIVTFALEETAELLLKAAILGTPHPIAASEIKSVTSGKRREEYFSHVWAHYERMDPKKK